MERNSTVIKVVRPNPDPKPDAWGCRYYDCIVGWRVWDLARIQPVEGLWYLQVKDEIYLSCDDDLIPYDMDIDYHAPSKKQIAEAKRVLGAQFSNDVNLHHFHADRCWEEPGNLSEEDE